ncbi:MAG: VWA domain-containing protein [Phycisphaerales bacterium]
MTFANPDTLLWLLALPLIAALIALSIARSRTLLRRFIAPPMLQRLAPRGATPRAILRAAITLTALALIITALARPQWGEEHRPVIRTARDVAFLIDTSKSMLAQDLAPNRLERAKLWVADAIDARPADRIAIVAFAGGVNIATPLTLDHAFARLALKSLSTDSTSLPGTSIGDAIRRTTRDVFELDPSADPDTNPADAPEARQRDIVIITDGEDHASLPVEAAAAAGQLGIRIITIGIGSSQGVNIPITNEQGRRTLLQHDGEPVVTRLHMPTLRAIAAATPGGRAIEVETGDIDLAGVYESLVQAAVANTDDTDQRDTTQRAHRFQWALIPAIALITLERLIPAARRRRSTTGPTP